jgi:glutathione S-transferase
VTTESYVLYHYDGCPFCARVQRFLASRGITMPMRDILLDPAARRELVSGGGRPTVPCLKVTRTDGSVQWLYESLDIIEYLKQRSAA